MPIKAAPGELYTVRRKVLKIFGAAFHIYDAQGSVVGYCKQKALRLKEDIRVYTGEDLGTELLVLKARNVIDFGATYDVTLPSGESLASFRRKGLKSTFIRDEWLVFDAGGAQIATLTEMGGALTVLRRLHDIFAIVSPQKFELRRTGAETHLATLRQHFNLFVYRLGVAVHADDPDLDELLVIGSACLIAAIEGRQR